MFKYDGNVLEKIDQIRKNGVFNIQLDSYNRIWYQDFNGKIYYIENNVIKTLPETTSKGFIEYIISNDIIYVIEQDFISYFSLKDLKKKSILKEPTNGVVEVFEFNGRFGIIFKEVVKLFDKNNVNIIKIDPQFKKNIENPITTTLKGKLYLFDKHNSKVFYTFDGKKLVQHKIDFPFEFKQNITSFDNEIWLSTTSGIVKYNIIRKNTEVYFPKKNISQIFKDKNNHYWISTLNEGILFVESFKTKVFDLKSIPTLLSKNRDNLIISTEDEKIFSSDNDQYKLIHSFTSNHGFLMNKFDESENRILATSSTFKWIDPDEIYENYIAVKDLTKISKNNYAFAGSIRSGLVTNDPEIHRKNQAQYPKADELIQNGLYFTYILSELNSRSVLFLPKSNLLYFATNYGLITVKNDIYSEIKDSNGKSIYLKDLYTFQDFIIGLTNDDVIVKLNETNQISNFVLPSYIKNATVEKIKVLDNLLFIFTSNAVYEYDLIHNSSSKMINLTPTFKATDVERIGSYLYFATTLGILKKNKYNFTSNFHPWLDIDKIIINSKEIDLPIIKELHHNENNIDIHFKVISKTPNEVYNIYYKINNSNWIKKDHKSRIINLSSLAPGNYNVKILIEGDYKSVISKEINFTIDKPFWVKFWFNALLISSIIAFIFYYTRIRIKKIKEINQSNIDQINLKNELNIQKLKSIKSQMNPHFFFNALNTIQSYILTEDKKLALFYLSKFSKLTRKILKLSEKDFISLKEEIETNEIYLDIEKARFDDNFEYKIEIKNDVETHLWKFPSLLLQPIIENAIKHGLLHKNGDKKIEIIIDQNETHLIIHIIDNGVGRITSEKINKSRQNHESFATKAIENRVNILNQSYHLDLSITYIDLYNQKNEPSGTQVDIKLLKITYESDNN